MPHSVFTGRPMPGPGELLFLPEDTDLAVALAIEEQETCTRCGMPVAICSDPANQFAFEGHERVCWPTYGLSMHRNKGEWKAKSDESRDATMLGARFRSGQTPDPLAGLGISPESDAS